ncbi:MAG: DUF1587 domain-containing protein, partial [Gemmataceae bacterium]
MHTTTRWLTPVLILACTSVAWGADAATFAQDIQPILKQHCVGCHGADRQESSIRLDRLEAYRSEDSPLWTKVHEAIATGAMPPRARPRPEQKQQQALLAWIELEQKRAGVDQLRRLNRRELSAALQDVTGLPIAYADALPGDGKLGGFDTGATALQDAADSIDQVMQITRRAVDGIRFLEPATSESLALNLREAADPRKALESWKDKGLTIKTRAFSKPGHGLLLEPRWVGERDATTISVPAPNGKHGVLRLKLVVSAFQPMAKLPAPHLWVVVAGKDIDYGEITGTLDRPQELTYHVQLDDLAIDTRGIQVKLINRVEVPYAIEGFANDDLSKPEENVPGGTGLFRPSFDRQRTAPEKQPAPFIVLQRLEIEPGYT